MSERDLRYDAPHDVYRVVTGSWPAPPQLVGDFPDYDPAKAAALAAGTAQVWKHGRVIFLSIDGRDAHARVRPIGVTTLANLFEPKKRPVRAPRKPKKRKP